MSEQSNIPKHWLIKKLGEVGEIISGGTPSTKVAEYWNGKISWISPADLSGYVEKFILQGRKSITESGLKNSSARLIPKGSVLFSSRAPIGYVIIAGNELCTNQGFKSIVPNNSILSDYLFYYLKASKQKAEKVASGTTFKEISLKAFSELEIPIPPLPEQQTIVSKIEELLSDLENGKKQLQIAQQQLKVYRQSLLKLAFEGKLTNKDVKDGELPKGWKWAKIEDVALSLDYKRKPINKNERVKRTGHIPYYGANGRVGWIDDFIFDEPLVCIVEDETFTGRSIPFSYKITGKTWVNNHAHVLKPNEYTDIDFLNFQLSYYPFLPLTTGTTGRKKLTKNALMNAPVKVCSILEQNLIVSELESKLTVCDKIEETIRQSLQQAETLRQSILKKAFEGKLITHSI
ncbi:MAG: restriction endonuclease subunit S [Bacteroidota bacterium]